MTLKIRREDFTAITTATTTAMAVGQDAPQHAREGYRYEVPSTQQRQCGCKSTRNRQRHNFVVEARAAAVPLPWSSCRFGHKGSPRARPEPAVPQAVRHVWRKWPFAARAAAAPLESNVESAAHVETAIPPCDLQRHIDPLETPQPV